MNKKRDTLENAIRFGCGALLGAVLGISFSPAEVSIFFDGGRCSMQRGVCFHRENAIQLRAFETSY